MRIDRDGAGRQGSLVWIWWALNMPTLKLISDAKKIGYRRGMGFFLECKKMPSGEG